MDRQVSLLRRRQAETAGWLGVRVRHSAGQEGPGEGGTVRGDSPGSGAGHPPALGSSCTPGVEWVVLRQYNRGTGSATMAPWSPSCSPGPSPHPGHPPLDGPLGPPYPLLDWGTSEVLQVCGTLHSMHWVVLYIMAEHPGSGEGTHLPHLPPRDPLGT